MDETIAATGSRPRIFQKCPLCNLKRQVFERRNLLLCFSCGERLTAYAREHIRTPEDIQNHRQTPGLPSLLEPIRRYSQEWKTCSHCRMKRPVRKVANLDEYECERCHEARKDGYSSWLDTPPDTCGDNRWPEEI